MMMENNIDELSARAVEELSGKESSIGTLFSILSLITLILAVAVITIFGWRWYQARRHAPSEPEEPLFPDGAIILNEDDSEQAAAAMPLEASPQDHAIQLAYTDNKEFSDTDPDSAEEAAGNMDTPRKDDTQDQGPIPDRVRDIGYTPYAAVGAPLEFSDPATPPPSGHDSKAGTPIQNSRLPYIAPIVKADLKRADERHDARFDHLQSGMTSFQADLARQIDQAKAETHDRLDLMIQALDRKLDHFATIQNNHASAPPPLDPSPLLTEIGQMKSSATALKDDMTQLTSLVSSALTSSNDDEMLGKIRDGLEALQKSTDRHHADMVAPLATLQTTLNKSVGDKISPLNDTMSRLEEKISTLDMHGAGKSTQLNDLLTAMHDKIDRMQGSLDGQGQEVRRTSNTLNDQTTHVAALKTDLSAMGTQVTETQMLAQKLYHQQTQKNTITKTQIALIDIVENTLDAATYKTDADLEGAGKIDCIINLPKPMGVIAIKNATSVDALDSLYDITIPDHLANTAEPHGGASDILRRQLLQQITDISSTCIIPGKTAQIAMMYIPSEKMYSALHTHFNDIIADSFRARVWIVSPATLMGALQSLKIVFAREPESQQLEAQLTAAKENNTALMVELKSIRSKTAFLQEAYKTSQASLNALLTISDDELRNINMDIHTTSPVQEIYNESRPPENSSQSAGTRNSGPLWPGFGAMGHQKPPADPEE